MRHLIINLIFPYSNESQDQCELFMSADMTVTERKQKKRVKGRKGRKRYVLDSFATLGNVKTSKFVSGSRRPKYNLKCKT